MKILVINEFGDNCIVDSEVVPRVGDKIDMFCEPLPTVTQVLFWPSEERLASICSVDVDMIITLA
jgi:hypothetical protein